MENTPNLLELVRRAWRLIPSETQIDPALAEEHTAWHIEASAALRALEGHQPAPARMVMPPFAEMILTKLARVDECFSDGQGADIGREWFDTLTLLGLLTRVQVRPAFWSITPQGEAALASLNAAPAEQKAEPVELAVWYGSMPESNGKTNWTAILHRKGDGLMDGPHITIDRSEYPGRVRYEADRVRHIIGELADEPDILEYDDKAHSGYAQPAQPADVRPVPRELLEWAVERWHAEVSERPLVNVHRRALDDTWRQVIAKLGGDHGLLFGPRHDDLASGRSVAADVVQAPDIATGVNLCIAYLENRASEYAAEHGSYDYDTGCTEFSNQLSEDYYNGLHELADELRALLATSPAQRGGE